MIKKNKNLLTTTISGDWFFMSSKDINARMIYDVLKDKISLPMNIWEEAKVLEIELTGKESIDFEQLNPYFKDDFGSNFLKEHSITTLFMVTFPPVQYEKAKDVMGMILDSLEGFFCADSEDFTPMIQQNQ